MFVDCKMNGFNAFILQFTYGLFFTAIAKMRLIKEQFDTVQK